ncbi:hypothetical protein PR002_g4906 [Phytophthora rubi]|uniref:Uncharacterized protein n=1 Tax=Phytophthora rubi TaxID=129364 RepID=A0A6A3N8H1_9STRA|nr:hypothetical protein PR002_g4906 [Phytophthora rubi]
MVGFASAGVAVPRVPRAGQAQVHVENGSACRWLLQRCFMSRGTSSPACRSEVWPRRGPSRNMYRTLAALALLAMSARHGLPSAAGGEVAASGPPNALPLEKRRRSGRAVL